MFRLHKKHHDISHLLFKYIEAGDFDKVAILVSKNSSKALLETMNKRNETSLHIAARLCLVSSEHQQIFSFLMQEAIKVNFDFAIYPLIGKKKKFVYDVVCETLSNTSNDKEKMVSELSATREIIKKLTVEAVSALYEQYQKNNKSALKLIENVLFNFLTRQELTQDLKEIYETIRITNQYSSGLTDQHKLAIYRDQFNEIASRFGQADPCIEQIAKALQDFSPEEMGKLSALDNAIRYFLNHYEYRSEKKLSF